MDLKNLAAAWFLAIFAGCAAFAAPLTTVAYMEPKPNIQPPESGFGFTVASADGGCAFLTTEHLIRKAETRQLFIRDAKRPRGYEYPLAEVDEVADVSLSSSIANTYFDGCPAVPTSARINELLYTSQIELVVLLESGSVKRIPMRITESSSTAIKARTLYPEDQLISGMSGAPMVAAGEPVAMLTKSTGAVGSFVRLDALPIRITTMLGTLKSNSVAAGPPPPLDVNRFPEELKNAVLRAWEVKRIADTAGKLALEEYNRAKEAATRADLIAQENSFQNGFARYVTNSGNYYRGAVALEYATGTKKEILVPAGPGVHQIQSMDATGNSFYCRVDKNGNCNGYGVAEFAGNKWNVSGYKRYDGSFKNSALSGAGILQYQNGWTYFAEFGSTKDMKLDFGSHGMNLSPDGMYYFDGMFAVNPNGSSSGNVVYGIRRWRQNGFDYHCIFDNRPDAVKQKSVKAEGQPYC